MKTEHRRAVLGALLALQGGLILLAAILTGVVGSTLFPMDAVVGVDASVAAVVLGAALVLAFRNPTRAWVNLAIMYNALTLVVGALRWFGNFGTRLTVTAMVVSAIFLVGYAVFYPRGGESMETSPA